MWNHYGSPTKKNGSKHTLTHADHKQQIRPCKMQLTMMADDDQSTE